MDSNTLILVLQSQDADYGRTNTLRKLINTVGSVTPAVVVRCAGLYDSDHGRGECVGIMCGKINSFDSGTIAQLMQSFDSDHGRNTAIQHINNKSGSILFSSHIASILVQFDSDHGRNSALKTLSSKITSVSGEALENILKTFDSDHGKNSAVETLSKKISVDATSMMSVSNQFDSDYSKASMIERMAQHLKPSSTKIPILTFWTSLGSIADEKKLALIQQNIDSLDMKYHDPEAFCNSLSTNCDDPKSFVTICEICGVTETIYKAVIDRMTKESSIITICNEQHNVNEFEIGKTYIFDFEDDSSNTRVQFTRKLNNQAYVSTKTVNKKYGGSSMCSSTITLKRGVVIGKGSLFG